MTEYLTQALGRVDRECRIMSLGRESLPHALDLARRLPWPCHVTCIDRVGDGVSPADMPSPEPAITIARRSAEFDRLLIEPRRYDLVVAHTAFHAVSAFERLFDQIAGGLGARGLFHLIDVTGKNRTLIWEENERFANAALSALPAAITGGARLSARPAADPAKASRLEDILPLLHDRFSIDVERLHGTFMRFVCEHPVLAGRFDRHDPAALAALDFLIDCDEAAARNNVLRPLEIWGFYRAKPTSEWS
jgi:hypothetical protein